MRIRMGWKAALLAVSFLAMGTGSSDDRLRFVVGLVVEENWGYAQFTERPAKSGNARRRFMSALMDKANIMEDGLRVGLTRKLARTFGCVQDGEHFRRAGLSTAIAAVCGWDSWRVSVSVDIGPLSRSYGDILWPFQMRVTFGMSEVNRGSNVILPSTMDARLIES